MDNFSQIMRMLSGRSPASEPSIFERNSRNIQEAAWKAGLDVSPVLPMPKVMAPIAKAPMPSRPVIDDPGFPQELSEQEVMGKIDPMSRQGRMAQLLDLNERLKQSRLNKDAFAKAQSESEDKYQRDMALADIGDTFTRSASFNPYAGVLKGAQHGPSGTSFSNLVKRKEPSGGFETEDDVKKQYIEALLKDYENSAKLDLEKQKSMTGFENQRLLQQMRGEQAKDIEQMRGARASAQRQASQQMAEQKAKEKKAEREKNSRSEVDYRADQILAKADELYNAIKEEGTMNLTGPHDTKLQRLIYEIAIDYAKLVDPGSVAREGEVAAAQKFMLPVTGFWIKNNTALKTIDDFRKSVRSRKNDFLKNKLENYVPEIEVEGGSKASGDDFDPDAYLRGDYDE
jgi:uncharacterized protein (DUF305 family)